MNLPKISFGLLVLNGEPFIKYNLHAIYPFAYQIIIVEGASIYAKKIADGKGHSNDGSLETLKRFQQIEDPQHKIIIVTAEDEGHPDGFWTEKDEMSNAYVKRSTGDYIWQVDIDEFYLPQDMSKICDILLSQPDIHVVEFPMLTFWGGLNYIIDGFFLKIFKTYRIFKWRKGYRYIKHRPPTIVDENGLDIRNKGTLKSPVLKKKKIYLYHYDTLLPNQACQKTEYYGNVSWANNSFKNINQWLEYGYKTLKWKYHPHIVDKYPSWLLRYNGVHPPQIENMFQDILNGKITGIKIRNIDDIEEILHSRLYNFNCKVLTAISFLIKIFYPFINFIKFFFIKKGSYHSFYLLKNSNDLK